MAEDDVRVDASALVVTGGRLVEQAGVAVVAHRLECIEDRWGRRRWYLSAIFESLDRRKLADDVRVEVQAIDATGLLLMSDSYNELRPDDSPARGLLRVEWHADEGDPLPTAIRFAVIGGRQFLDHPVATDRYPALDQRSMRKLVQMHPKAPVRFTVFAEVMQMLDDGLLVNAAAEPVHDFDSDDSLWVTLDCEAPDVVEGDVLAMRARQSGTYEYTTIAGKERKIPWVAAKWLEVIRPIT